jgi:hypothetical protein
VLHEVVWGIVGRVADALEGAAGGGLAVRVVAYEGASAVAVLGLVASPKEECEAEEGGEESYSTYCAAGDGADVLF